LADNKFLVKMQERWHLKSITQVVLVLIVFTLTGSSVVFLKPFVFKLFGIQEIVGMKGALLYILLVFPLYQILLMVYGTLLGQFDFFWKWQKKIFNSLTKIFRRKGSN